MKTSLYHSHAIEVRMSSVHGYGVFATRDIAKGEIIEECYYLRLGTKWKNTDEALKDYVFMWSSHMPEASAVVLGNGMIYNHSDDPNVGYKQSLKDKVFKFLTINDVNKEEELLISYGTDSYAIQRIKKGLT